MSNVAIEQKPRCGCGGELNEKGYCLIYWDSKDFDLDVSHELTMRAGGLGFGVSLSADDAMMSMHRQAHGATYEEVCIAGL